MARDLRKLWEQPRVNQMFAIFFLLSSAFAAPAAPGSLVSPTATALAGVPVLQLTPALPKASPPPMVVNLGYFPTQVNIGDLLQARRAMAELLGKVTIDETILLGSISYVVQGYVGPSGLSLNLVRGGVNQGGININERGNVDVRGVVDAAILRLADPGEESDFCSPGARWVACLSSEATLVLSEGVAGAPIALDFSVAH